MSSRRWTARAELQRRAGQSSSAIQNARGVRLRRRLSARGETKLDNHALSPIDIEHRLALQGIRAGVVGDHPRALRTKKTMTPETPVLYDAIRSTLQHDRAGVLIPADPHGRLRDTARLITVEGEQTVHCVLTSPKSLRWKLWRVRADLLPMPNGDVIVTSARRDDTLDPLVFVQPTWCPIPGTVSAMTKMIQAISHPALRQFIRDVFADFRVFEDFWKAEAGPAHHHWPGGLAAHALEVAQVLMENLDTVPATGGPWSQDERDLGILTAVLHDLGECRDNGRPLPDAAEVQRRIMELRHLEIIHDPFSRLHGASPRLGRALLALWFPRQRFPASGIRTQELRAILLAAHRASVLREPDPTRAMDAQWPA